MESRSFCHATSVLSRVVLEKGEDHGSGWVTEGWTWFHLQFPRLRMGQPADGTVPTRQTGGRVRHAVSSSRSTDLLGPLRVSWRPPAPQFVCAQHSQTFWTCLCSVSQSSPKAVDEAIVSGRVHFPPYLEFW